MLSEKIPRVLSLLNERQQRLYLAIEAEDIGHGGILLVSHASGISRKTIIKGKKEYQELKDSAKLTGVEKVMPVERIRKQGAGRKDLKEQNPKLLKTLDLMLEPITRGHPESVLKWTCLSMRALADALKKRDTW
jgi:hypothetical protein